MAVFHVLGGKFQCIFHVGQSILVEILRHWSLQHKNYTLKSDANEALAEIIKLKKLNNKIRCLNYPAIKVKINTGTVEIDQLDITALCQILLNREFCFFETEKCCNDCKHECSCPGRGCKVKVECIKWPCHKCGTKAKECRYMVYCHCIETVLVARNTVSHSSYSDFCRFEDKAHRFPDFPSSSTWDELCTTINDSLYPCMKLLLRVGVVQKEKVKDWKMYVRVTRRCNNLNGLLSLFSEKELQMNHFADCAWQDMMQKTCNDLRLLAKGSSSFKEIDGQCVAFGDFKKLRMTIKKKTSNSCEFYFDITEVENTEVKDVEVRSQGCSWQKNRFFHLSNSGVNDLVLEINDLKSDTTYDIKAYFKCGGNYCLSEHFGLKIKGDYLSEEFKFKEEKVCIEESRHQKIPAIEMIPKGVLLKLPPNTSYADIMECKIHNGKVWITLHRDAFTAGNGWLKIDNLTSCEHHFQYSLRKDESPLVFASKNIKILEASDLPHVSTDHEKSALAICHSYGLSTDIHQRLNAAKSCEKTISLENVTYSAGGECRRDKLSTAFGYLKENFGEEESSVCFPKDKEDVTEPTMKRVLGNLEAYASEKRGSADRFILLTEYDTKAHFKVVGLAEEEFGIGVWDSCEHRILVFDSKLQSMVNIRVARGTSTESIKHAFSLSHEDLKALHFLHSDLIKRTSVCLVSVVVVTGDLSVVDHYRNTGCATCADMIFTSEGMEQQQQQQQQQRFNIWWEKNVSDKLSEERSKRGMPITHQASKEEFLQVVNRIMVVMSLHDLFLPCAFGSINEKIITLVLKKEQIRAIRDKWKKKLISGAYGSGKSIVIQQLLKQVLETVGDDVVLYAITWDALSLMSVELQEYCQNHKPNSSKVDVICGSIVDILPDNGANLLSLPRFLEFILLKHQQSEKKKIYVVVDEFAPTCLTEKDLKDMQSLSNIEGYNDLTISICLQSLTKERTLNGDANYIRRNFFPQCKEIKEYPLPRRMRCTVRVHQLVEYTQQLISSKFESIYQVRNDISRDLSNEDTVDSEPPEKRRMTSSDFSATLHNAFTSENQNLDKLAKFGGIGNGSSVSGDTCPLLKTTFSFAENQGCGHSIDGKVPIVVRLVASIDQDPVSLLASTIDHFLQQQSWKKQALFICNDHSIALQTQAALNALRETCVSYLHAHKPTLPTPKKKQEVYRKWKSDKNAILLTDNRGSCGLQHEKVFIVLDEEEEYEHFLLPESMSRATSDLVVISFKPNGSSKHRVGLILDALVQQESLLCEITLDRDIKYKPYLQDEYDNDESSSIDSQEAKKRFNGLVRTWSGDKGSGILSSDNNLTAKPNDNAVSDGNVPDNQTNNSESNDNNDITECNLDQGNNLTERNNRQVSDGSVCENSQTSISGYSFDDWESWQDNV